jgi:phosphoglycerate kinase
MKSLNGLAVAGKNILLRADFNVPMDQRGVILDDSRIRAALPTILYLVKHRVKQIILVSHLGRPKGKVIEDLKLKAVAQRLCALLKIKDNLILEKVGDFDAYKLNSQIYLLENIRFYKEEEGNNLEFAKKIAHLGDIFINDAFSCSHRAHASIEGVTHFLPSYAGLTLKNEVETLSNMIKNPKSPFVCILGGAKVSDKIDVIRNLAQKVDWFLLGGVMANTFLKVKGFDIKSSTVVNEKLDEAKRLYEDFGTKIILPIDYTFGKLDGKDAILDIGQATISMFANYLRRAKTIFWNGNLGMTEIKEFATGSKEIARAIVSTDAMTIAGGGDTVSFLNQYGFTTRFSFVSLGGGATLEFLAGKKLPGLAPLT